MDNMEKQEIEQILGELVFYINPEFLKDEFKPKITPGAEFNKEITEKYYKIIISIDWFLKKIKRYEVFFSEFYPESKNIKNYEALEHHIHAYLEDVETLKNKLCYYVGTLKNDLNRVSINKKEVSAALDFVKEQINKAFEKVSVIRGDHRHRGYKFVDVNVSNCQMADIMLSDASPFKNWLTDYAINKYEAQRIESFEKGKDLWVKNVKTNIPQLEGVTNDILKRTKNFLYNYLEISPLDFEK